ncbi:MAG TPA: TolC family protein [Thermoanaerobaculia bacterium]|jgi:outer membrane protein TolC|nr:TolC family protein [Thermoanaerobaculia bacterium]
MRNDRSRIFGALAFCAIVLLVALPSAVSAVETTDRRLSAAIERALARNPEIQEMELKIEAARNRVLQARALPDPTLTLGAVNVPVPSFSFGRDDMTMKMASLEQMVPAPGKRRAAAAVANSDIEIARALYSEHVNRLVSEVADSFYEIAELDARLSIAHRILDRATRVSESARSRYRVGQGALPDPLLAAVEETKFRDRIRALEADRAAAAIRFNTLQNLPATDSVPAISLPFADRALPDVATVRAAIEQSPAVVQAQAEIQKAERELDRARLDRRPDLTFMTSYGERERRDDMVGATVGIDLPFFQAKRVSARIAEKQADLAAARKKLESVRLGVSREVEEALIALARDADRAALYRDTILTQDRTAAEAAEQAYAVGKIDFQTYVRAVLAVDEDEAEAVMREAALPRARARLQAATGFPFFAYRGHGEDLR